MLQNQESDYSAHFQQGNDHFYKGSYEDAISEYIKIMQTDQQSYKYFCERGNYFAQLGNDQAAVKNFIDYYNTITPSDLVLYIRAISDFTEIIPRCPQFKYCYNDRGNVYSALQKYEQAIQDYSEAIKLDSQYAVAYSNRALVLSDLGRKEEALADYSRSIEINPKDAEVYYNRAILLDDLGREEEALIDYSNAIDINPQYADAYYNRGYVLKNLGRKEEALINYSKAIKIDKQYFKAYFNRGNLLDDLGRQQEALIDYTQAIEINPQYAKAYHNRGTLLDNMGRKEEALIDFSSTINIDPQDADAYCNRGNVFKDLGRTDDAYNDYVMALHIHPDDPMINVQLGMFFLNNGESEKACEYMNKCQQLLDTMTQLDKQKYSLHGGHINYIKLQLKQIQQIDQEISKVKLLIKSKNLTDDQQQQLMQEFSPIESMLRQQLNLQILKDSKNATDKILSHAFEEMLTLKQKVSQMENQRSFLIKKEMDQLQKDEKRYTYYLSLYWRLYNYISACQQLSTELFKKNTEAAIDKNNEKVALITTKVVTQISDIAGSIPIAGSVIKIISNALEFSFSKYLDYKFNQIVMKLTQIVQVRCDSKNDFDEEIQLAIIQQSKKLQETLDGQQEQSFVEYIKQICQKDKECGNKRAQDPYWIKGIEDTLKILQNLLLNYDIIQQDEKKKLHIVIVEQFQSQTILVKEDEEKKSWRNNCCQIQ